MKRQRLFIGLIFLGIGGLLHVPAFAVCTAVGNSCTATVNNPRGNCCVGTCVTYSGQASGPGFCGEEDCYGCSNCNTSNWTGVAGKTGYETRSVGDCDCNTCIRLTQYRCAADWYGWTTNGVTGCTHCPESSSKSPPETGYVTGCYLPANVSLSDNRGNYTYTSDCYYTN